MNVRRSPIKAPTKYGDSDCLKASLTTTSGGSQPDLRQSKLYDSETQQVTFRPKRKHSDDDINHKLDAFENRVLAILNTIAETQNEKLNTISQDVSLIKDQVMQIKSITDRLVEEQNKVRQELVSINNFNSETDNRIKSLEINIDTLKSDTNSNNQQTDYNNLISEIHERSQREKNLIITGINEIFSKNTDERRNYDKSQINDVIRSIIPDCPAPIKVIRLGKYDSNKSRPIKVCFEEPSVPKLVLKNKSIIQEKSIKVKIYSDQTPYQKRVMQSLKDELKNRTEAGEKDLTIKYIKGIPKIIQNKTKN